MRKLLLMALVSTSIVSYSYSQSRENKTTKNAVKELLESIYKNDSISEIHVYENDGKGGLKEPELTQYFHCMIREERRLLNVDVTLITKPAKTFCYPLDINGIKAYINPDGDIQQSPFTDKVFGNIETKSLLSIISNQTFQEYWDIPKDNIEVCKDCEFRYVCNDGRIPLKRDNKTYYFEESCTYDPYKTN